MLWSAGLAFESYFSIFVLLRERLAGELGFAARCVRDADPRKEFPLLCQPFCCAKWLARLDSVLHGSLCLRYGHAINCQIYSQNIRYLLNTTYLQGLLFLDYNMRHNARVLFFLHVVKASPILVSKKSSHNLLQCFQTFQ